MEPIQKEYTDLAETIGATILPVGPAWARALEQQPDIRLYHPDGTHPSNLGSYLTACVMFAVLTGKSPIGLPARLISEDVHGEQLYLNIIMKEQASFLQKVAEEVVREF